HPVVVAAPEGDVIVKAQSNTKTIEAGAEIRSAGRNAHRDLLHPLSLSPAANAARLATARELQLKEPVRMTWIDGKLLRDFEAERTNAHRLCTARDGWIERYADDVLVSFKNEEARERLTTEYLLWAPRNGFTLKRMFGRLLP